MEWSRGQIKTCRKKQHVEIGTMKEMPDLICGKTAVGGNYNSMRDSAHNAKRNIKYDENMYNCQGLRKYIHDVENATQLEVDCNSLVPDELELFDSELKEIFDWIDENCVIKMVAA